MENEKKICPKCKKEKYIIEFNKHVGRKSPSYCKICNKENLKEHYKNNKSYYYEKSKKSKKIIKKWFKKFKNQLKCNECEENHPACLYFHHITSKETTVSRLVIGGYSIKKIKEEIEKCIILCANCHRKLHYDEYFE